MTVTITQEVLGKLVGQQYTGPLESWLLNEGYARNDADSLTDVIPVTPTAAVLVGSAAATDPIGTAGNIVFATKDGVRTTVALLGTDTAAQAATKIDTALAGMADAAIVSTKLQVTSIATGPTAYVEVFDGDAAILTALKVTKGQVVYGAEGRPTGANNTGAQADLPVNDPTKASNREAAYWPKSPDLNVTIANDATNLTKAKFPIPNYDFDQAGTHPESPAEGPTTDTDAVYALEPDNGVAGDKVKVYGINLNELTGVTFDGVAGTGLVKTGYVDTGYVTITVPAGTAGPADVVLQDPAGNKTLTAAFTYNA